MDRLARTPELANQILYNFQGALQRTLSALDQRQAFKAHLIAQIRL